MRRERRSRRSEKHPSEMLPCACDFQIHDYIPCEALIDPDDPCEMHAGICCQCFESCREIDE